MKIRHPRTRAELLLVRAERAARSRVRMAARGIPPVRKAADAQIERQRYNTDPHTSGA